MFCSLWFICSAALWWGLWQPPPRGLMPHAVWPRSAVPRAPETGYCWPVPLQETLRHSKAVLAQSLWGLWVLVHTRFCLSPPASLEGMGFDSKCDFSPPTILMGFLLCPWMWGLFFVGSNILLSIVVQCFVNLECSQEKMSAHPSTPPSCVYIYFK